MEKRLEANPDFKERYGSFMGEYENMGDMSIVKNPSLAESHFCLPHHGVLKKDSLTTKLRVVFDGSLKTSLGVSLNDTLSVGPNVQTDLFSILRMWRKCTARS